MAHVRVGGVTEPRAVHFACEGQVLAAPSGHAVRLYHRGTGETLATLAGHVARVTGVVGVPGNKAQLVSGALDGTLRVWDVYDGQCLKAIALDDPVHYVLAGCSGKAGRVFAVVQAAKGSRSTSYKVVAVDIDSLEVQSVMKVKNLADVAVRKDGKMLAVVAKQELIVWYEEERAGASATKNIVKKKKKQQTKTIAGSIWRHGHSKALVQVEIHPDSPYLAVGDCEGRIILWYKLKSSKPVVSELHWHAHAVGALAFSEDGAYLLSGGEEAVLVIWQLESGHKQFLPRLGAPILAISVSEEANSYALTCADNAIRVVDSITSQISTVIKGLVFSGKTESQRPGKLTLCEDPRTHLLTLNGAPSTLQFYDPFTDRHVFEVDAVERNYVSRMDNTHIAPTKLEHFAFSRDGRWLATSLYRHDGSHAETVMLQFWKYNPASHRYGLCARIDAPHKGRISSVEFHPTKNFVVTTGSDRLFKIWRAFEMAPDPKMTRSLPGESENEGSVKDAPIVAWKCHATVEYRGLKSQEAQFSSDGSLIAVAHGAIISLWNSETLELCGTLAHSHLFDVVRGLRFASRSPYLIAWTDSMLYVWDLLSSSVWWSYSIRTASVCMEPDGDRFAVLASTAVPDETNSSSESVMICLFECSEPTPLKVLPVQDITAEHVKSYSSHSLAFLRPRSQSRYSLSLAYANDAREIICVDNVFDANPECISRQPGITDLKLLTAKPQPKLQKLFGITIASDTSPCKTSKIDSFSVLAAESLGKLFNGPTHLLPPISAMYSPFMELLRSGNLDNSPNVQSVIAPEVPEDEEAAESAPSEEPEPETNPFPWSMELLKDAWKNFRARQRAQKNLNKQSKKRSRGEEEAPEEQKVVPQVEAAACTPPQKRSKKVKPSSEKSSRKSTSKVAVASTERVTRARSRRRSVL